MTGLVLAGGSSERMGIPKALLRLNGETFLERAVSRLRELCQGIIIAAKPGQAVPEIAGCRVVYDEEPGLGPLGGIVAGLNTSHEEWVLALACDMPLVRPEVLRLLQSEIADEDAVVPRAHGRLQPQIAAYSRACLEPAREALMSGQRAIAAMLDRVQVKILEEDELRAVDPELVSFLNANTFEDYREILKQEQANALT